MADLNEGEQRRLYTTLLSGLAQVAQDQLCASDTQHAWSQWIRRALKPDWPLPPVTEGMDISDSVVKIAATRACLNCGKEQHQ